MARPEGFEPTALCFGGTRSIHLSYGRAVPNFLLNSPLKLNQSGTSSNKPHNHTANERQLPRDGKTSAHRASFVGARLQPCRKRFKMAPASQAAEKAERLSSRTPFRGEGSAFALIFVLQLAFALEFAVSLISNFKSEI